MTFHDTSRDRHPDRSTPLTVIPTEAKQPALSEAEGSGGISARSQQCKTRSPATRFLHYAPD